MGRLEMSCLGQTARLQPHGLPTMVMCASIYVQQTTMYHFHSDGGLKYMRNSSQSVDTVALFSHPQGETASGNSKWMLE